jgi:putative peptide zinc metalloprotease protein
MLVLALVGLAIWASNATAEQNHLDNAAIAVVTNDQKSVFRFAFKIKPVSGDVVDQYNLAAAYASCTDCRATAIAIEIVLVEGSPHVFTPQNIALAINNQCTRCASYAGAYQIVSQHDGPVHFTAAGRGEIQQVRSEIRSLKKETITPFEIQARLDPLVAELQHVVDTELVPGAGQDGDVNGTDGEDGSNPETPVPDGASAERKLEAPGEAVVSETS